MPRSSRPAPRRDSLRFEEFNVRPITDGFALVTARYVLYSNGRTTASGPFTRSHAAAPGRLEDPP